MPNDWLQRRKIVMGEQLEEREDVSLATKGNRRARRKIGKRIGKNWTRCKNKLSSFLETPHPYNY
jgi:hypothetical protein